MRSILAPKIATQEAFDKDARKVNLSDMEICGERILSAMRIHCPVLSAKGSAACQPIPIAVMPAVRDVGNLRRELPPYHYQSKVLISYKLRSRVLVQRAIWITILL